MKTKLFALGLLLTATASSALSQTIIGAWTMGDDDAGAANGNAVNATLTASTGSNLSLAGTGLTYTDTTRPGSSGSLAVQFTGSGSYTIASNLGMTNNFAMETWVNFTSLASTQWVMLIGNGASSGMGIIYDTGFGGRLGLARSGDNIYFNTFGLTADTWYHVAVVVDENNDATMYFNGNLVAGTPLAVGPYASQFSLGDAQDGHAYFSGILDDARLFTYATGTFNPSMLSYAAVPEPSTYALFAGVLGLGLAVWRRRRSS